VQLWSNSHRREDVIPAMKNSLAALRLEYVDMFLMHWPVALKVGYVASLHRVYIATTTAVS